MKIDKKALVDIITETCEETAKDIKTVSEVLALIASTTVDVLGILSQREPVSIEPRRSRSLHDDMIVQKIVATYQERHA